MFVGLDGTVVEGRAISDVETLGRGPAVVWVDAVQPDGSTVTTPVPAAELRPVERL